MHPPPAFFCQTNQAAHVAHSTAALDNLGINKRRALGKWMRNRGHRCVAASLPDDDGQLSRIPWLDPSGYLVQPNVGNISQ